MAEKVPAASAATAAAIGAKDESNSEKSTDSPSPLLLAAQRPSPVVRDGDHVILVFADGKEIFTQALRVWKGKGPPLRISKRAYSTENLIGLAYGTVLELRATEGLRPLPPTADVVPELPALLGEAAGESVESGKDATLPSKRPIDNRNLIDDNTSQNLKQEELLRLRDSGMEGSEIVSTLIENSATFDAKTDFSKAKYIKRKQQKYQPRCRLVRCTPAAICRTMFLKEPRKIMNLRDDTLGQLLSYSNVSAGCQVLVMETTLGILTGSLAQRLGGYGRILSVYTGQQPAFIELLGRFNLSFAEQQSIKWVHSGELFKEEEERPNSANVDNDDDVKMETDDENKEGDEKTTVDEELAERNLLEWPCPLQDHTRTYMEGMTSREYQVDFLSKRSARFARKLTRHTTNEANQWLESRPCDSIILATKHNPTATLLDLLPYLAPSSPFVVYCEYLEPLSECFSELQKRQLALNLRLSDTWTREYQILPGRTHPQMSMSQSGGFVLTGCKLCPETGHNDLDENLLKEIREQIGGRRGKKKKYGTTVKPNKEDQQQQQQQKEKKRRRS